ncbi:FtsK/SpoIIIE domain-containing protein [Nocardiopsis sp. CT-R113]|uniref:FtsK/SpoIIIE domain-containing protein n=1 Tax=Nocardiopsis codii TaxID=3065942 RepID=A0ABU7K1J6_9ACTN|nr:FtsK/SpoIIIE domain-containing protein [Nocardiopsis sp. CT-R113]MEE2036125.1 FtsK/SpoIIIE domain-containing protein [Nocardiopsis sp. CT-R113]
MSHPEPHDDRTAGENVVAFPTRPAIGAVPAPEPDRVERIDPADVEVLDESDTQLVKRVDDLPVEKDGFLESRRARISQAPDLIPSYLRNPDEFTAAARFLVEYYARVSAYQATRSPIYLLKLMGRAPRGAGRAIAVWGQWAFDTEANELRKSAAGSSRTSEYMMLSRQHTARVRARLLSSLIVALGVTTVGAVALASAPAWASMSGIIAMLALFGAGGRKADAKPIIDRWTSPHLQRALTSEEISEALDAIGIKGSISFAHPIQTDGPGWRAEIDLPKGSTSEKVMDKRQDLAGAMRRPVTTVWPSSDPNEHPARLNLWVAKRDPAKEPRRIWPLMNGGQADLFKPIPLGWDPRGNLVTLNLMYSNLIVGGIPGSGKTSAALAVALGVALDPKAQLWVYELKGSGDLGSVKPVCHRYVSGDDDEDIEDTVKGLRAANAEQKRRKKFIQSLPVNEVADGRRTSKELAAKYPKQNLDPMVVIVDEAQELFTHEEYGKEAEVLCRRLIKKARAYGIILILLTQDPDAASLPPSVSRNAGTRLCLAVMDWRANNNVLGTGAFARGLRATDISANEVGTGILAKQRDHWTVRAAFIKQTEAEEIGKRALALRTAAGTLTGEAAGEEVEYADTSTVVDHLRAVWPDGAASVHSHRLVEALAKFRADLYGPWVETDKPLEEMTDEEAREARTASSTALTNALRDHKIPTRQITIRECCGGAKGVRYNDLPAERADDEDEADE